MSFKVPPDFDEVDSVDADTWDPDSQVYLLRVPKGSDISKLNGVKFSHSRVKQFGNEDHGGDVKTVYELTPFIGQTINEQPLVSVNGHVTVGPPLSGLLSVTKSYRVSETSTTGESSNLVSGAETYLRSSGPVPMPEGLRVRFSPFGSGQPVKSRHERKKNKLKWKKMLHSDDSYIISDFSKKRCLSENSQECSHSEDLQSDSLSIKCEEIKSASKHKKSKKSHRLDKSNVGDFEKSGTESGNSDSHHMRESEDDPLMFVDRKGSGGLPDGSSLNGSVTPLLNGMKHKSPIKNMSSSDETSLNTSEMSSVRSEKKKRHKKDKNSKQKMNTTL